MTPTRVEDDERLYRSIRRDNDEYVVVDGKVCFAASAFNDSDEKPSVDRSSKRDDPRDARLSETDGIAQLVSQEVRAIGHIRTNPDDKKSDRTYKVDVVHRPILKSAVEKENLAHCQIECSPDIKVTHFKKRLREALANLASAHGWAVEPTSSDAPPAA